MSASAPDDTSRTADTDHTLRAIPDGILPVLLDALQGGPTAVGLYDPDDRLVYANDTLKSAWAVAADETPTFADIIRHCHQVGHGAVIATDDIEAWLEGAERRRRSGPEFRAFEADLRDGRWFWITERRLPAGWILIVGQDITALKHSERTLKIARDAALEASLTDPLTQLPNRRRAMEELARLVADPRGFCLALIDLDHFKRINDSYGHVVGDGLLKAFADRLRELDLEAVTAARLAGDEFAVISAPGTSREDFEAVLKDISGILARPFDVRGYQLAVRVSIGAAVAPADGREVGELLIAADTAMYHVKLGGRSGWCFHHPDMGARARQEAELRCEVAVALAEGQFVPFYQPLVDLATGRPWGFEILARWQHPRHGLLTPDRFLSLFPTGEELTALTSRLLTQASLDVGDWPEGLRLAFNTSAQQLSADNVVGLLQRLADDGLLALDRLEMEITEAALLRNPEEARAAVEAARAMGLTVALDDFGVGFSSLHHLREIRFDRVKMDRSFVRDLGEPRNLRFLDSLVRLAQGLELAVTVEGIEDRQTEEAVRGLGCDVGQGFLFGRPLPAAAARRVAMGERMPGRSAA